MGSRGPGSLLLQLSIDVFTLGLGKTVPLLISVLNPDRIRVHHGREMTPMLDQEPDEIFQKAQQEKGPTR